MGVWNFVLGDKPTTAPVARELMHTCYQIKLFIYYQSVFYPR